MKKKIKPESFSSTTDAKAAFRKDQRVRILRRHIEAGKPNIPGQGPIELALQEVGVLNPKITRVNGREIAARLRKQNCDEEAKSWDTDHVWIVHWAKPNGRTAMDTVNQAVSNFQLGFDAGADMDEEDLWFPTDFFSDMPTIQIGPIDDAEARPSNPKASYADLMDYERNPRRQHDAWEEPN